MYYGIYLPNFGDETSVRSLATLAHEAEAAGWDGFFIWDHMVYRSTPPVTMVDPWIALTAMAMTTEHLRLGTTVTPLARRHPWKIARETASLDQLSGGRLTLGVGLGEPVKADFANFGEETDNRVRAAKLDEGLDILTGLWSGKPFRYKGTHYQVEKTTFLPSVAQDPRIPIWVAGYWPLKEHGLEPEDIRDISAFIHENRSGDAPFDIVKIGMTPEDDLTKGRKIVAPFIEAGATWWLESLFTKRNSFEALSRRIRQGPPK